MKKLRHSHPMYKGSVRVTRGNDLRLEKSRVKYDLYESFVFLF